MYTYVMYVYIYIYFLCGYIYIYIERERDTCIVLDAEARLALRPVLGGAERLWKACATHASMWQRVDKVTYL